MFCISLVSCGTVGDYYVFEENGEEKSHSTLHRDKSIFVHLNHFDGNISTLTIYQRNSGESLGFRVVKVDQSLSTDNTRIPSSSRDDTKGILAANSESSVLLQITEVFEVNEPFERVTEKIDIELFINDKQINISKEFPLKRVTYNRIQALMGI